MNEPVKRDKKFRSGRQMKVARVAAGMTHQNLADAVYANRVTITNLERQDPLPYGSAILKLATLVLLEYDHINIDDSGVLRVHIA